MIMLINDMRFIKGQFVLPTRIDGGLIGHRQQQQQEQRQPRRVQWRVHQTPLVPPYT